MAYSSTIVVSKQGQYLVVTIAELEAAASSETDAIETGYKYLTLMSQECILAAGTGTTIDPVIGNKAGFAVGDGRIFESGTAAAGVMNNNPGGKMPTYCYSSDGKLYVRSTPDDATGDHTINSTYLFKIGW